MTDTNFSDMASRWWVQAATPELNKRTRNKPILDAIFNVADLLQTDTAGLKAYLKQLAPRKAKSDPEQVAYYDNSYKYANDRLTKVSSGRFIKKLFPSAPDHLVEGFSIWWKENIAFDATDYKLVVGNTREDFRKAFRGHRRTSNLSYQNFRKSISDSCMRYAFEALPCHPSEVYASGDFEVVTVKDKRGKTRARCVVRVKLLDDSPCYVHGYIYASDNYSASLIEQYLADKNAEPPLKDDFWHEARLLNIPDKGHYSVCPYVDGNRYAARYGEQLVLVSYNVYDNAQVNSTSGRVYLPAGEDYDYGVWKKKKAEREFKRVYRDSFPLYTTSSPYVFQGDY